MSNDTKDQNNAFTNVETTLKQYWEMWNDAAQRFASSVPTASAAPTPAPAQAAWNPWAAFMPQAAPMSPPPSPAGDPLSQQLTQWWNTMQQVTQQFAGQENTPASIANAWKNAFGGDMTGFFQPQWMNPMSTMAGMGNMGGLGNMAAGMGNMGMGNMPAFPFHQWGALPQWQGDTMKLVDTWRQYSARWLDMPGIGPAREHQTRWQALGKAQQEYQQQLQSYGKLMQSVSQSALSLFEKRLGDKKDAETPLTSARALFDTWIDAAEEAYANTALTEEFQQIYATLTNSQMRLHTATLHEIEQAFSHLGLPGRTEIDNAHRKIAQLERAVRELKADLAELLPEPESNKPATPKTPPRGKGKS